MEVGVGSLLDRRLQRCHVRSGKRNTDRPEEKREDCRDAGSEHGDASQQLRRHGLPTHGGTLEERALASLDTRT